MRRGVTRARFEELARDSGYTVREYQLDIYYSSLGRSYLETFLEATCGEKGKVCYNLETIRHWVTEEYLIRTFERLTSKQKETTL